MTRISAYRMVNVIDNMKKRMSYFLIGFLAVLVYFVGCRADSIARKFVFQPPKYPIGDWSIPGEASTEVHFLNSKGQTLIGRYFDYQKTFPGEKTRGSILYCHGNGENISYLTDFTFQLSRDLHCNILIFDYAGYGKSDGEPTAPGILDDGRAARNWLAEHNDILNDQVIVYGQSLGGSVATDIAAKDGARALIIESSFTSLGDMGRRMFPFLPVNWLLHERLASVEKIGNVHCPVFISHGKGDGTIPFSHGQRLFNAANEPKTFYIPPPDEDYHSAPHCREHRKKLQMFVDSLL